MRPVLAFVLVAAAACGDHGSAPGVDGAVTGNPGMAILWRTQGELPGVVTPTITVTSAAFKVHDLRVIGDAGGGDSRTTPDHVNVAWTAAGAPSPVLFPDAPTGLYSKVLFELDGKILDSSYDLTGTVVVAGQNKPFAIRDLDEIQIAQTISAELVPGGHTDVVLVLDLEPALATIDFTALPQDDDTLLLDDSSTQMPPFRAALRTAFTVAPSAAQ